jgi:hypothetical protein
MLTKRQKNKLIKEALNNPNEDIKDISNRLKLPMPLEEREEEDVLATIERMEEAELISKQTNLHFIISEYRKQLETTTLSQQLRATILENLGDLLIKKEMMDKNRIQEEELNKEITELLK